MPTPNLFLLSLCIILASCNNQEGIHIDFSKTPPTNILINDANTRSIPVNFYISAQATDFDHFFALSSVHKDSAFLSRFRFSGKDTGILMDKKIDLSTYLGLFHDTLSERYGLDKNDKFYEEDFSYLISSLDIRFFLSSGKDGLILIALQNPLDRALEYRTRDNTILWVELDRELKPQKVLFPDAGEVEFFTSHMSAATHHMLPDSSILISNFTIHNTQLVLKNEKRLMYFEINDPCVFHKHDPATGQTHCFYSSEELDSNEDLRINAYATEMNNSLVEEGYWPEFIFKNNMFLVKRPEGFENYERHISNMLTVNLHNGESTSFSFEKHVSVLSFLPTNNGIWLVMDDPEGGSRLCFYRFN